MRGSENIYLVMTDSRFRSACFSLLAIGTSRIVRGFPSAAAFIAESDELDGGCVVIERGYGPTDMQRVLMTIVHRSDLVPIVIAASLEFHENLTLIRAGVGDILPATSNAAAIAERVERLLPEIANRRQQIAEVQQARKRLESLSPRERDILIGLARGQSSKEIAREYDLSPRTVEVHRANIMRRADADSLAELLRLHFLSEYSVSTRVPA